MPCSKIVFTSFSTGKRNKFLDLFLIDFFSICCVITKFFCFFENMHYNKLIYVYKKRSSEDREEQDREGITGNIHSFVKALVVRH